MPSDLHSAPRPPADLTTPDARGTVGDAGAADGPLATLLRLCGGARWLPWWVLAGVWAVTAGAWWASMATLDQARSDYFDFRVREARARIEQRLTAYEQVLLGAKGLHEAAPQLTRDEFRHYVAGLQLQDLYPGIQGVGYAAVVPAAQLAQHEAAMRRQGFPLYAVRPAGPREVYTSIVMLEPFAGRNLNAHGFDMFSEPVRREAMARARDTGAPALSGRVRLVQESGINEQAGFLVYVPVYRHGQALDTPRERQDALAGWAYAPFRMNDLMAGLLGEQADDLGIEIFDGREISDAARMYGAAPGSAGEAPALAQQQTLAIAGHEWTLRAVALPGLIARVDSRQPLLIAVGGGLTGLLLAWLAWLLLTGRERALALTRAMNRELIETSQRFALMADSAPVLIWIADTAGRCTWVNQGWLDFTGGLLARALGRRWADDVHPDDRAGYIATAAAHWRQREPFTAEVRLRRHDGTYRWMTNNGVPRFDADGRFAGFIGSCIDITERRQMEAQLRSSSLELADLYQKAPCGYHSLDANGLYQRINDTELDWLGCRRDEVIGRLGPADFFDDEDRRRYAAHWQRFKTEGRVDNVEFDLHSRDGSVRRVSVTASALATPDGRYLSSRSVMFDISDLHRARAQLQALAQEQAVMLDTELVGIFRVRGRRIVWKNRGVDRLFGHAGDTITGQSTRVLYLDDDSFRAVGDAGYQVLRAGGVYRTSLEMARHDGSRLWIDLSGVLLSAERDESMWMMSDITPMKRAEALRLKALALEEQNRQLQEVSRVKGLFLANVSHELRTPLNAVIGFAEILERGIVQPGSPKYAAYLHNIGSSGRMLLRLIDGVLDLTRLEAGRIVLHPEWVDLPLLLQAVVDSQQLGIDKAQLTVAIEAEADVQTVQVDATRLQQIVGNFLSNAVKFTPAGGAITLRTLAEGADQVRIEVQDSGIGIREEDLPRLFTAFVQLSEGSAKRYPGTGLGLAIVQQLATAMQGSVGARSIAGHGSVFHCVLPRRAA